MFADMKKWIEMERFYGISDSRVPVVVAAAVELARFWVVSGICRLVGHQWIDSSAGNPEHGYVDLECGRCGKGFHQVLY